MITTQATPINREFVRRINGQLTLVREIGQARYIAPIQTTVARTERGLEIGYQLTGKFVKVS